jgi:hypothetical protein
LAAKFEFVECLRVEEGFIIIGERLAVTGYVGIVVPPAIEIPVDVAPTKAVGAVFGIKIFVHSFPH